MRTLAVAVLFLSACLIAHSFSFDDDVGLDVSPAMSMMRNQQAFNIPQSGLPYQTIGEEEMQFGFSPQLPYGLPQTLPRFLEQQQLQTPPDARTITTTTKGNDGATVKTTTIHGNAGGADSGSQDQSSESSDQGNGETETHSSHHGHKHIVTTTTTTVTKRFVPLKEVAPPAAEPSNDPTLNAKIQLEREKVKAEAISEEIEEARAKEARKRGRLNRQIIKELMAKKALKKGSASSGSSGSSGSESSGSSGSESSGSSGSESSGSESGSSGSESSAVAGTSPGVTSADDLDLFDDEEDDEDVKRKHRKNKHTSKDGNANAENSESSEKSGQEQCNNKDGCNKEDDLQSNEVKQAKSKFSQLDKALKSKLKEMSKEEEWTSKAVTLLNSLKKKVSNVKLHMFDLHKDIKEVAHERNVAEQELSQLQKHADDDKKLKTLQSVMEKLMTNAQQVKNQITSLSQKKEDFIAKMEEVKQSLLALKAKHESHKIGTSSEVVVVAQLPPAPHHSHCPCHLPARLRLHCTC